MEKRLPIQLFLLGSLFFITSCASYTSATKKGFEAFERRDYESAIQTYNQGAEEEGVDQLVYLFDRATVLHTAGKYSESSKDFIKADKLSEIKDYTALGTEVASIITNDRIISYKGEEFENVLISTYIALNFVAQGKWDDAIVACRQVNRKLERLRDEGKRKYNLSAFAQYLAGLLFEKVKNWNFAYVDYKRTLELVPEFSPLKMDLIKGAIKMGSSRDMDKWMKTLGVEVEEIQEARNKLKSSGSIVLLYENGFSPVKVQSRAWYELPEYESRYNKHRAAVLFLDGKRVARTEILYNVEDAARENLKEKYATYLVKRIAGIAAREVIAYKLNEKTPGLGTVVGLAMYASSQPDLRSWTTLPRDFQIARVDLAPGKYHAEVRLEDWSGNLNSEVKDLGEVEVKRPGDIAFVQWRSLND